MRPIIELLYKLGMLRVCHIYVERIGGGGTDFDSLEEAIRHYPEIEQVLDIAVQDPEDRKFNFFYGLRCDRMWIRHATTYYYCPCCGEHTQAPYRKVYESVPEGFQKGRMLP